MRKYDLINCFEFECAQPGLEGPCHVPSLAKSPDGYCRVYVKNKAYRVHRYCYEREVGPIPAGMVIDHLCLRKSCCNVKHLRVVTRRQNALENNEGPTALNARKKYCAKGHPFTAENTRIKRNGSRQCWICRRAERRLAEKKRKRRK